MDALTEIIDRIDALPRNDQRRLLAHLQEVVPLYAGTGPVPIEVARKRYAVIEQPLREMAGVTSLSTKSRKRPVVWARHIAAFQMRTEGYTTIEIARCLGRDHATVINSYRRVADMLEVPDSYREEMTMLLRLREELGGRAL